ncbi:MAG: hypothetical protein ACRDBY_14310 [Cetobacterium sp.]
MISVLVVGVLILMIVCELLNLFSQDTKGMMVTIFSIIVQVVLIFLFL